MSPHFLSISLVDMSVGTLVSDSTADLLVLTVVAMMYEECFNFDAFLSENKKQKITHSQPVAVAAVAKKKQKKN